MGLCLNWSPLRALPQGTFLRSSHGTLAPCFTLILKFDVQNFITYISLRRMKEQSLFRKCVDSLRCGISWLPSSTKSFSSFIPLRLAVTWVEWSLFFLNLVLASTCAIASVDMLLSTTAFYESNMHLKAKDGFIGISIGMISQVSSALWFAEHFVMTVNVLASTPLMSLLPSLVTSTSSQLIVAGLIFLLHSTVSQAIGRRVPLQAKRVSPVVALLVRGKPLPECQQSSLGSWISSRKFQQKMTHTIVLARCLLPISIGFM